MVPVSALRMLSPEEKTMRDLRKARIERMIQVINALPCKPFVAKRKILKSTEDMLAMAIGVINKATPETLSRARSALRRIPEGSRVWDQVATYMVTACANTDKRGSDGYVTLFARLAAEVNRPDLVRALKTALDAASVEPKFESLAHGSKEWREQDAKAAAALNTMVLAAALYRYEAFTGGSAQLVKYSHQLFLNVRALASLRETEAIHVNVSALERVIAMMRDKDAAPVLEHVRAWLKGYHPAAPDYKGINGRARFNLQRIGFGAAKDKLLASRVDQLLSNTTPFQLAPAANAGAGIVESAAGSNAIEK